MRKLISTLTNISIALTLVGPVIIAPVAQAQLGGIGLEQIQAKEKRRIAILNFDITTVSQSGLNYGLYSDTGAGQGISNLLTNELVKDGTYVLVERSQIEKVLAEQDLGQSGRIEPSTAARIGRVLGVDAVLIGSITQFNVTDSSTGGSVNRLFGLGGKKKRQKATVQLATRLVSAQTGEILASADGLGEADKSTGAARIFGLGADTNADHSEQLLGEASTLAVESLVSDLVSVAPRLNTLPAIAPVVEMVVADITGNEVTFNKGGNDGFRPGMIVSVERIIKEIKDPVSGDLLRRQTQQLGQIQLTEVQPSFSVGKTLNGTGFQVGDIAKAQ